MCKKLSGLVGLLIVAMLLPMVAMGQGLLVDVAPNRKVRLPRPIISPGPRPFPRPNPRPVPSSYKIKQLDVKVTLTDQVAKVQVTQSFVNTGSRQMEVVFMFPLPYDGAISRLTLMVDGKEYEAKLLDAKQARSTYEAIVRKNQDPALLEWMGTGMFQTSVFPVPPGAERKVSLSYTQLCRTDRGLTDFLFPLSTAKYTSKPVETVSFTLNINSGSDIKNVYSPTHEVEIKRPANKQAIVTYTGKNEIPTSDFRLMFDVGSKAVGTSVLTYRPKTGEDGYLLLLASPEVKSADAKQPSKTIVFVVDRSGSMSGKKIEQAKAALKFVLNNLSEGDLFNIVAYDSVVESFAPELQRYDNDSRKKALGFVEGIYAGGSTNISGALKASLGMLKDTKRPSYVIFLTDGKPTTGVTTESQIVADAKSQNNVRARLISFGVGYDVNSRLLDKLARANFGQSEYVRPNEDIENRVASLYNKIDSPVLTDVVVNFDVEGAKTEDGNTINRLYPKGTIDLFAGQQLVLVGRYKKAGDAKVTITGTVGGEKRSLDFPAKLVASSGDETYAFVEKLWAMRRVGELIDEIDLQGRNQELVKELVTLSQRHGILTPYTSFFADDGARGGPQPLAANIRRAEIRLKALDQVAGKAGFAQRDAKKRLQEAAKAPSGAGRYRKADDSDELVIVNTVKNLGSKTFYRRGEQWVDSTVTAELEKKAIKIKRYSKEYFALVDKYGKDMAKYLAIDEPVVLKLGSKVYEF
jgi:Ca-activated chloride channel family protein